MKFLLTVKKDMTTQILLADCFSFLYLDIRCFPKFEYLLVICSRRQVPSL